MLRVQGRDYPLPARRPVAVLCIDGCDPTYVDDAIEAGVAPTLDRWRRHGTSVIAEAAFPTFTNPNNLSIVTGAPPAVHGISGNYHLDPATGEERPLSRKDDVRAGNILVALCEAGVRVAAVTAKKKLLAMLALPPPGRTFAAEHATEEACALAGRGAPDVYSADASLFVLDVGVALLARKECQVVYLSTTDYVQHKHGPGTREARAFYQGIDERLARLDALGAVVVLTADHGMGDKTRADGSPAVTYLEPLLGDPRMRVILPITDPYVVHHGALGGMAMVYGFGGDLAEARRSIEHAPGVEAVLDRAEAARRFELPPDRIGDLVVLADARTVLGKRAEAHDLTAVAQGLRSHGSTHEQAVPLISNVVDEGVLAALGRPPRNADAFALALAHA